jgi:hypothetical protein
MEEAPEESAKCREIDNLGHEEESASEEVVREP